VGAVTKEPLARDVTSLFAGCEPNKRQIKAVGRAASDAAAGARCGGVSECIRFRRLARRPTLFTTGNRHTGIPFSIPKRVPGPCAAALGFFIG
jgi:hypothetical protein